MDKNLSPNTQPWWFTILLISPMIIDLYRRSKVNPSVVSLPPPIVEREDSELALLAAAIEREQFRRAGTGERNK